MQDKNLEEPPNGNLKPIGGEWSGQYPVRTGRQLWSAVEGWWMADKTKRTRLPGGGGGVGETAAFLLELLWHDGVEGYGFHVQTQCCNTDHCTPWGGKGNALMMFIMCCTDLQVVWITIGQQP